MKISQPVKVILGILTIWVLIYPFLFGALWFVYLVSFASANYQYNPGHFYQPPLFFFFIGVFICSAFLQVGLQAFYIVHNILNKTGSDVVRATLGVLTFILPCLALPAYFFIYISPRTPPAWALASTINQVQASDITPS